MKKIVFISVTLLAIVACKNNSKTTSDSTIDNQRSL